MDLLGRCVNLPTNNIHMERKQIEKAAFEQIKCCDELNLGAILEGVGRESFIQGANWRIKSVWHDVSKRPDENEPTIIEFGNNKFSFHEKGYKGPWKYNVEQFGFKRWAYVKDLLPED